MQTKLFLLLTPFLLTTACSQETMNRLTTPWAEAITNHYLQKLVPTKTVTPEKPAPELSAHIDKTAAKISSAITPRDSQVRHFAAKLAQTFPGPYNIGQVCAIWYPIKNTWKYTNDPRGADYFATASETAWTGGGDCDDFAIFIASLIEAIGGSTRIVLATNETSGHAYCEVFLAKTETDVRALCQAIVQLSGPGRPYSFHYHKAKDGCWLNLDWSAEYPGGPYFKATQEVFIYPDGHWHL